MEHAKIPFRLKPPALLATLVLAWIFLAAGDAHAAGPDDLVLELRDNVVKITSEWEDGGTENGFGFIVGERSGELYIATANHVVRRAVDPFTEADGTASRVRVEYFSRRGESFEATLLATSSPEYDLAVLRALAPERLSWRSRAVSPGDAQRSMPVWFVGRAGDWYVPSSPGAVNSVGLDKRIAVDNLNVQVGTSGAPLVGENGILGMIVEEAGGIAYALPINFIEEAFRYWNHPWQLVALADTAGGQTGTGKPCRISGLVFDSERNSPLSSIWIDLYRDLTAQGRRPEQLQAGVATTGPDGRFSINCDGVAQSDFPLLLALRHRDWTATRITGQSIAFRDQWENVNIALALSSITLKQPPGEPPVRPGSGDSGTRDFTRGETLYNNGDFRAALPLLKAAAEAGNGKAAYYLGNMYLNGRGVASDDAEAVRWIRRSAAAGEAEGLFLMGTVYARGLGGVARNDRSALAYYHRAAEAGAERAYWQLGLRYERGIGAAQDLRQAVSWYRKSAQAGNRLAKEALVRLGIASN